MPTVVDAQDVAELDELLGDRSCNAWPMGGDQRINAVPVVKSGLGIWPENWSWQGEEKIVTREEIAEKVKEMMADEGLMVTAHSVGEEARWAAAPGGTSYEGLVEFVRKLKKCANS